ncbi:MAG: AAA family ATPase, partial [Desulfobacteraceae bacterium]|nr:AAA family ATPase [Desulfobacteraceae bacterium]
MFCGGCGSSLELEMICPHCGAKPPKGFSFCNKCGHDLQESTKTTPVSASEPTPPFDDKSLYTASKFESERKHVTVLFSDMSGYTAMSERLDPEDVKEITSRIFGRISKVIAKYEGFVEKFIGDAVMALFGVPNAHEDDPVRAIRAAREIHDLVEALNPELEERVGRPLSMHTGINTGLVVTGEVHLESGTLGVAGDALNVASRLSSIAGADEIVVGHETFRQAMDFFEFERKEPIQVKGKSKPLVVYRVVSTSEEPGTFRRFSILKAKLIGRMAEMDELREAVEDLRDGKGRIFSISGDAGTGKSRLIEEFKGGLDLSKFQWLEGHAYAYCQNIPYFPLINLLNHIFHIDEEDHPEKVREKIESGIESLLGQGREIIPYIGSLYSIQYPEIDEVSPDFWKARLQEVLKTVISKLALKAPTIFFLEDLHWADPSFVELLRNTLLEIREPAIVLCAYRPIFNLFTSHQLRGLGEIYREIRLQDLSSSESLDMLTSLLKTGRIPFEVRRFVEGKAEGNPFYLEEMVNSLIESDTLVREGESWELKGPVRESTISPTIHGVIDSRLDRLEKESKRVLQEASVIGRSFLYEILHRISNLQQDIDKCLRSLEQRDLIRTKSFQPDLEYLFKHALTQEVVYNGLLISHRREIHERIGLAMEQLFSDRLPECYETLAFHFSHGTSILKAVEYLVKSGEKSHKRYALEESHQYFKEAYELLSVKDDRTGEEDVRMVDLLLAWGYVHNCRSDYKGLEERLLTNEDLAKSLEDKERLGMFYAWIGWALRSREKLREGYDYLLKALQLAEEVNSQRVIGYACAWLSWTCADLGLLDEAVMYGKRAQALIESRQSDGEFVRFTLAGLGVTYYFRGDCAEAHEVGELLLDYGQRRSDLRCMTMGHTCMGFSHYVAGNHALAIQSFGNSILISADTLFTNGARLLLGMTYVSDGQFSKAAEALEEIMRTSDDYGFEFLGTAAKLFYGVVLISQGRLNKGMETVEDAATAFLESDSRYRYATANYTIGKVYARVALGESERSLSLIAKNI